MIREIQTNAKIIYCDYAFFIRRQRIKNNILICHDKNGYPQYQQPQATRNINAHYLMSMMHIHSYLCCVFVSDTPRILYDI